MDRRIAPLAFAALGCASPPPPPPPVTGPPPVLTGTPEPPPAGATPVPLAAPAPPEPLVDIAATLFPEGSPPAGCAALPRGEAVRCLFAGRFGADADALRMVTELHEKSGDVVGVLAEQDMEGGFRGRLHLVPEPPTGRYRKHLAWVASTRRAFDEFFAALAPLAKTSVAYRHRPLAFRFFRSVGRTTPSAFAEGWTVSYNVSGSLHGSAEMVRDTLFHEIFHLNDAAHGDWSARTLSGIFDAIVKRCGTRVACLAPYAPGDTMVRGGTYYAFQPDNGESVHEYAAELATRYYTEHRLVFAGEKLRRPPFKCGPAENRRAWEALAAEFFGGADAVPPCS